MKVSLRGTVVVFRTKEKPLKVLPSFVYWFLENDMKIYDLFQTSRKYNATLKFTNNNIKF